MPLGTEIYEIKKSDPSTRQILPQGEVKLRVADLDEEGSEARLAKGGTGGNGNFKDKQLYIP